MGSTLRSSAKDYKHRLAPTAWYDGSKTLALTDKATLWWDDT